MAQNEQSVPLIHKGFAMKETTLPGVVVILLGLGLIFLVGCKEEAGSSSPPPRMPEVQVMTVETQTVADEPEFIGQAESSRPVEIRSQVTGILKERFFQEGREVKKGDRLYRIDPVPFRAAMISAKARVAQAQARLVQAKQDLARVKPLLAEQAVSQKDVDDAVAEELAAKAGLEAAKGDLVKAEFDLDNTLITAPIDGLIERTRFYEGRLISAQTDLLTIIYQVDPMYVTVSVPETYILQRRRELATNKVDRPGVYNLRGVITFTDGTTYSHDGVLDLVDVKLRTDTGSREGRFVFPNPDHVLLPGQFVKVRVKGYTKANAVLIPQRAVQQSPKGSVVFVVGEGEKVEVRDVKAASWRGNEWLIEEGLRAGDRVIVEGIQRIGPGDQVKPVPFTDSETPAQDQKTGPPSHGTPGQAETAKESAA